MTEKKTEEENKNASEKKAAPKKQTKKTTSNKKVVDISPFISNPEGNIYAVTNLPEEFIATLFAWVSRSPKSFKEHLRKAIVDFDIKAPDTNSFEQLNKKAYDFHKKWTVDYGHSSVAENAVAHVGIEKVSRIASAELELSNTFLSLTEYSQRYQKPKRGDWHNPISKTKNKELYNKVESFYEEAFSTFELLVTRLHEHLDNTNREGLKTEKERTAKSRENQKLAFEDARYVLPLSMYTQLGMTANGRAWRDGLAKLDTSDYSEVHDMKTDLKKEITKVLPVLLRHADASPYQKQLKEKSSSLFNTIDVNFSNNREVHIVNIESEKQAIDKILAYFYVQESNVSYRTAQYLVSNLTDREQTRKLNDILFQMKHFDTPPEIFHSVNYGVEFLISEANWHQLLRHNRKTHFTYGRPSPHNGFIIPPRIVEAGLEHRVKEIEEKAKELYLLLKQEGEDFSADYVLLNAHKRQILANFDLWEAYHLINLRTSDEAQWEIKGTFDEFHRQLEMFHPTLISMAKRRL